MEPNTLALATTEMPFDVMPDVYDISALQSGGIDADYVICKGNKTIEPMELAMFLQPDSAKKLEEIVNMPFIPVAIHVEPILINNNAGGKIAAPKMTFLTKDGEYILCTSSTAYQSMVKLVKAFGTFDTWPENLQLTPKMNKSGERTFYKFVPSMSKK